MKTNMEKEIFSQKEVLKTIWEKYKNKSLINFDFDFEEIKFIASGSSYNAARLGQKFFENCTEKRTSFEYASEFISNPNKKIKKDTLYCFVSQSGETYDTKCALEIVKNEGGKTLSLVNNSNSTIYNAADFKINVFAGTENSIAATKSFLACVVYLWLLAFKYSSCKPSEIEDIKNEAICAIGDTLDNVCEIENVAKKLYKKKKISILGYSLGYILAKEMALKIKETSYIDTSSYPTGEFLHGHTAILNTNKTLIVLHMGGFSKFEENTIKKIKKDFNPKMFTITDCDFESQFKIKFKIYKSELAKICAMTVILQLLALKIAELGGHNVDKPHGLNKVVLG